MGRRQPAVDPKLVMIAIGAVVVLTVVFGLYAARDSVWGGGNRTASPLAAGDGISGAPLSNGAQRIATVVDESRAAQVDSGGRPNGLFGRGAVVFEDGWAVRSYTIFASSDPNERDKQPGVRVSLQLPADNYTPLSAATSANFAGSFTDDLVGIVGYVNPSVGGGRLLNAINPATQPDQIATFVEQSGLIGTARFTTLAFQRGPGAADFHVFEMKGTLEDDTAVELRYNPDVNGFLALVAYPAAAARPSEADRILASVPNANLKEEWLKSRPEGWPSFGAGARPNWDPMVGPITTYRMSLAAAEARRSEIASFKEANPGVPSPRTLKGTGISGTTRTSGNTGTVTLPTEPPRVVPLQLPPASFDLMATDIDDLALYGWVRKKTDHIELDGRPTAASSVEWSKSFAPDRAVIQLPTLLTREKGFRLTLDVERMAGEGPLLVATTLTPPDPERPDWTTRVPIELSVGGEPGSGFAASGDPDGRWNARIGRGERIIGLGGDPTTGLPIGGRDTVTLEWDGVETVSATYEGKLVAHATAFDVPLNRGRPFTPGIPLVVISAKNSLWNIHDVEIAARD